MNKFLKFGQSRTVNGKAGGYGLRRGLGRLALRAGTAIAAACVFLLAARAVLAALTYAGPISVTAKMGNLAPSLVQVNSSATSSPSAYYTPPPGVPEGQLSASYSWSATVLDKATWLANGKVAPYLPPKDPATAYTATFSPNGNAQSGSTTLTFTPHEARYWQISVSCEVTVTDTTTNQYWSGSASAGPENLTSYILSFTSGTPQVDGSNLNVCVGEQIPLTASFGPSDMTLRWTVPGSIIGNYLTSGTSGKIVPVSSNAYASPQMDYFWMDTDSGTTENEKVTLAGALPNGQSPPSAITTFNVFRPVSTFTALSRGAVALDSDYYFGTGLCMHDGAETSGWPDPGVQFDFNISGSAAFGTSSSSLDTGQIADNLTATTEQYNQITEKTWYFQFILPSSKLPGPLLDGTFPYGDEFTGPDGAYYYSYDAPAYGVPPPHGYGFGTGTWSTYAEYVSETFTRDLIFLPQLPDDAAFVPAPLSTVQWYWGADLQNQNNGGYQLSYVFQGPTGAGVLDGADLSSLPQWNNSAQDPTWGWGNPQWTVYTP